MNNNTSFRKADEMLHLAFRCGEYRIIVNPKNKYELLLIARFTPEDMDAVVKSKNKIVVVQNIYGELQHSISVESTIFNLSEKTLIFEVKGIVRKFVFTNEEWDELLNLQWNA